MACPRRRALRCWEAIFTTGQPTRRATRSPRASRSALKATDVVELKSAERARAAAFVITAAEAGALHRPRLRTRYQAFEPLSRDRLVAGSLIPASWVVQAQRMRRSAYLEAMHLFERYDLLLAPATPCQATAIGTEWITLNGRELPCRPSMGLLTQPISCIGLPVCAVPLWLGEHLAPARPIASLEVDHRPRVPGAVDRATPSLPIGVQLIAAPWREDVCLAAARALEAAGVAQCRIA